MGRGRSHQGERRKLEWGSCSSASGAKVTGFQKEKEGRGRGGIAALCASNADSDGAIGQHAQRGQHE